MQGKFPYREKYFGLIAIIKNPLHILNDTFTFPLESTVLLREILNQAMLIHTDKYAGRSEVL